TSHRRGGPTGYDSFAELSRSPDTCQQPGRTRDLRRADLSGPVPAFPSAARCDNKARPCGGAKVRVGTSVCRTRRPGQIRPGVYGNAGPDTGTALSPVRWNPPGPRTRGSPRERAAVGAVSRAPGRSLSPADGRKPHGAAPASDASRPHRLEL